jgi:hypothetical protein
VGTFGSLQNMTGILFAQSNMFGIWKPDWQGLLQVPSAMIQRLTPNSYEQQKAVILPEANHD